MKKFQFRSSYLGLILLTLPRTAFTLPFAYLAPLLFHTYGRQNRAVFNLLVICCYAAWVYFWQSLFFTTSLMAFLLQTFFYSSFFVWLAGFRLKLSAERCLQMIRWLNGSMFVMSLANMVIYFDFPMRLPYVHYLPDAYSALFFKGGAKIVTVIGLFGVLAEIYIKQQRSWAWLAIAASNFILPSYLLGIVAGLVAFLSSRITLKKLTILPFVCVSLLVFIDRYDQVAAHWQNLFDYPPKVEAFYLPLRAFADNPLILLFGTGLGQFSSEAAIWASDFFGAYSRGGDLIPGLRMSELHEMGFGDIAPLWQGDFWMMSSSANKPYSGWSNLMAEFGLVGSTFIFFLVYVRLIGSSSWERMTRYQMTLFLSVMALNLLDSWFEQPWFVAMLIFSQGLANSGAQNTADRGGEHKAVGTNASSHGQPSQ